MTKHITPDCAEMMTSELQAALNEWLESLKTGRTVTCTILDCGEPRDVQGFATLTAPDNVNVDLLKDYGPVTIVAVEGWPIINGRFATKVVEG